MKSQFSLTLKQERFCKLYVKNRECFGNATRAYAYVYGGQDSNANAANGSRLLTNDKVINRIYQLINELVPPGTMERELAFCIVQKINLPAKVSAIIEFNKINNRTTPHKIKRGSRISWVY